MSTTTRQWGARRLLLVLAMVGGLLASMTTGAVASDQFTDVGDSNPFHDEISWLVDRGITTGYPSGEFKPVNPVTRQAAVAFLYRQAGSPDGGFNSTFSDVPATHPFYHEISWASAQGITDGYDDGEFKPAHRVTRQAAMAFIFRGVGKPDGPWASSFSDVPATHPFYDEISWGAEQGITDGYDDGEFKPGNVVTRQAIAAFLYRLANDTDFEIDAIPFDAFTVEGTGDDVIDLVVPDGDIATATFEAGSDDSGNFIVWSNDSAGDPIDLLVNQIGAYAGTRPLNLPDDRKVAELEINADGPWTITVAPISALEPRGASFSGTGDDVVILSGDQLMSTKARLSHDGHSNFIIWTYGARTDLIVNEIGPYEGTVKVSDIPFLWDITASGTWTVQLE